MEKEIKPLMDLGKYNKVVTYENGEVDIVFEHGRYQDDRAKVWRRETQLDNIIHSTLDRQV